jgi:two-component system catabolic regulation response regulator CreB
MSKYRILLVEDESSIADFVRVALRQEGFALDHVKTAGEALVEFRRGHHALLILDVGLPDQSGFDLCREIRKTSRVPILFLTARSEEVDKIVGFELGADDYLTKPFSPRELAARARAILNRIHTSDDGQAKSYGQFVVDPERFRITFAGVPLELSRYEFKLLHTLIRRPGIVFSRAKLMELVWEDPSMSLERTVDTHIKSIRAKLKMVKPELNVIETHRGLGYSLKEN